MLNKLAKFVRVISVAPIMALPLLLILYFKEPAFYGNIINLILSIFFLTVLPLLAYPLQPLFKKYKDGGREGQRSLAIIFAVAGYVFGCISAAIFSAPLNVWIIYIAYLLSGALVMLINKVFHFKASGHACGITGPSLLLLYFGQPWGYIGAAVLLLAWLSSLYMKRHTTMQFIAGALLPVAALIIIILVRLLF
jgi:hypothetical protein